MYKKDSNLDLFVEYVNTIISCTATLNSPNGLSYPAVVPVGDEENDIYGNTMKRIDEFIKNNKNDLKFCEEIITYLYAIKEVSTLIVEKTIDFGMPLYRNDMFNLITEAQCHITNSEYKKCIGQGTKEDDIDLKSCKDRMKNYKDIISKQHSYCIKFTKELLEKYIEGLKSVLDDLSNEYDDINKFNEIMGDFE